MRYSAALLTAAALVVLLLAPTQARYTRQVTWPDAPTTLPAQTLSCPYDLLTPEGTTLLMAAQTVSEGDEAVITTIPIKSQLPVAIPVVAAAEGEPVTQAEESTAERLEIKAEGLDGCIATASYTGNNTTYGVADDVTLTLELELPKEGVSTETKQISAHVTVTHGASVLQGTVIVPLQVTASNSGTNASAINQGTEPPTLISCMEQFNPQYPFCVDCTGCTEGTLGLNSSNGTFPIGTRFSTDGGKTYITLGTDRSIPLKESGRVYIDLSKTEQTYYSDITLNLTANSSSASVKLTYNPLTGENDVTYTDGLPTVQLPQWNSKSLEVSAVVERLAWVEEKPAPEGESAKSEPKKVLQYVNAEEVDAVIQYVVVENVNAVNGEGTDGASQPQTLAVVKAEGVSHVPSGAYRLRIQWIEKKVSEESTESTLVTERVIPFFLTS